MASGMWPLSAGLDLGEVVEAEAPLSKVLVPLPKLAARRPPMKKIESLLRGSLSAQTS
jgi:hypothetical protein